MSTADNERRSILKGGVAAGAMAATASMPFWSRIALGASEELIPFTDMPDGFTAPPITPGAIHYLDTRNIDSFYVPAGQFYLIQHYNQPELPRDDHRVRFTGLVDQPFDLSMGELRQLPKVEIDAGFECGGNSRNLFQGLIGNARWGGVRLRDLLERAGVRQEGIEVVCYGADTGEETIRDQRVEQSFARSMHINDAMRDEVMLAYEMNGEPLPHYHGAPVRLLVPGWYGVANVKWLTQVHVQDRRFMGRFMGRDYVTLARRDIGGEIRWEERSVTRMRLKSSIIRVTRNGQRHNIMGFALNDGTPLRGVEVKIDDGPWRAAEIDPQSTRYSWKLFNYAWDNPAGGEHSIVSRVIDANGQVQPTADELPEKPTRWENNGQFPRTVRIS